MDERLTHAIFDALVTAQLQQNAPVYNALMSLMWTRPLSASHMHQWDQLRPTQPTAWRIPDPRRSPAQAIRWGMDPYLARTARERSRIYKRIEKKFPYPSWLRAAALGIPDDGPQWDRAFHDLSVVCGWIRAAGLAKDFGLARSGED